MKALTNDYEVGQVVMTAGVCERCSEDQDFNMFVFKSLLRHMNCDWGDLEDEDVAANDYALDNMERILSSYHFKNGTKIWIITEYDRSYTTILFPNEY